MYVFNHLNILLCVIVLIYITLVCVNVFFRYKKHSVKLKYLDDDYIKDVNILGTHNSLTFTINNYFSFHGKTQRLTIEEQYAFGVRFFDIRLIKKGDTLEAYHGIIKLGINFDEVKQRCKKLLENDNDGFIIFSVKNEIDEDYELKDDIFIFNNGLTQLKISDVKGKILIINYYSPDNKYSWPYNKTFKSDNLKIQDNNEGTVEDKIHHIENFTKDNNCYNINFLTLQTNMYLPLSYIAKSLQSKIKERELLKNKKGFVFVFDYVELISNNGLLEDINLPIV